MTAHVAEYLDHHDDEAVGHLQGVAQLLAGMLRSDGIVLFRSNGSILAYRSFVHLGGAAPRGGSRRRAFEALRTMVGHDLVAALFRSHDGDIEYAGAQND